MMSHRRLQRKLTWYMEANLINKIKRANGDLPLTIKTSPPKPTECLYQIVRPLSYYYATILIITNFVTSEIYSNN